MRARSSAGASPMSGQNVGRCSDGDRCLFVTEVLNFVTHRTPDGSDVSSLSDAWRSDTSAGDRIICG
ncbi:hypothetical protein DPMN_189319 [Dreissena polymorpha]|uniref:Uncharacterized protein n=1 Tax=Dreissena polymorpha TaxID=45954 RepID=A0A9D4DTB6_DREPO|nr:hypothetical protein DPMN_189319 [Dreissena polymorpha]